MNRPPSQAARFHDDDDKAEAGKRTRQLNPAAVAPQAAPLAALIRRLLVLASLAGALSAGIAAWLAGCRP